MGEVASEPIEESVRLSSVDTTLVDTLKPTKDIMEVGSTDIQSISPKDTRHGSELTHQTDTKLANDMDVDSPGH